MEKLGDKVAAKTIAKAAGIPLIPDSEEKTDLRGHCPQGSRPHRLPGDGQGRRRGGGRGMRVVREEKDLDRSFEEARNEARNAFGDDTIFLEKYVEDPKHLEVQILGDNFGNIVHLYERDCSVQRRFQKVVEIAPSLGLKPATREKLYQFALRITRSVNYNNAGTVEFLVDKQENVYFIEVNPRIQVEHTITEEITGIDIVRSQILIAQGLSLSDKQIYILSQESIPCNGFAIQCRITTEDPANNFKPDYGTIIAYRNAGGYGIRLDEGNSYAGVRVSPFFDSMLVKVSAKGRTLWGAADRLHRALREFRIRGVKTNIGFSKTSFQTPFSRRARPPVNFIANNPELLHMPRNQDRATRMLSFMADVVVNGNPDVGGKPAPRTFRQPIVPPFESTAPTRKAPRTCSTNWARRAEQVAQGPEGHPVHRHHVPRRPPVAAGYPRAHHRHAPRGRRLCQEPPGCFRWKCGAGPPSTCPCASCTKTPGNGCGCSGRPSPTSCSRCSSAAPTRWATRPTPTTWWNGSSKSPGRQASTSSAFSIRSTGWRP
jgi:pyruvate carboxylase